MAGNEWLARLSDVSYAYPNGVQALRDFSVDINHGEVLTMIGPSGCGKSTLISIVSGLRQAEGVVAWNPLHLKGIDGRTRRRLNVVFQRDTVMPWLSVEKNVGFGLRFLDLSKSEKQDRVDQLLDMGGLGEFRKALPHELSGGMVRRVALLTGIAPLPELLILDEPFSALDEPTRIGIHNDLLKLARRLNMTIMLVTHDLGEAVSLSDRICVLTSRPATMATIVEIPLGRERDMTQVRALPEYQDLYRDVWESLWQQIKQPA